MRWSQARPQRSFYLFPLSDARLVPIGPVWLRLRWFLTVPDVYYTRLFDAQQRRPTWANCPTNFGDVGWIPEFVPFTLENAPDLS